jgi:hypothetical protein
VTLRRKRIAFWKANATYTHSELCNIYCSSTVTAVMGRRLDVVCVFPVLFSIHTIYKSGSRLDTDVLRGCALPSSRMWMANFVVDVTFKRLVDVTVYVTLRNVARPLYVVVPRPKKAIKF